MAKKTNHEIILESNVNANGQVITQTPIISLGKEVTIIEFSGSCATDDWAALQWGEGANWETIRASYGNFNFKLNKSYKGDGQKRFRIVRANSSANSRRVFAYIFAIVHDA